MHKGAQQGFERLARLVASAAHPLKSFQIKPLVGLTSKGKFMSSFTKAGSEIYLDDTESVYFHPMTASHPYVLMVTDARSVIGGKAAWCNDCEGAVIDVSNDDSALTLSLDLHAIEHRWFESYPPVSIRSVRETRWHFYESLTPAMQKHENGRQVRLIGAPSTFDQIVELAQRRV